MRRWTVLPVLAGLFGGLAALATADMFKPSREDQVKLGQRAATEIRKQEKVLDDKDPRTKLLREIGQNLLSQIPEAERKKMPWKFSFDVIDNKEINAFALPGGPVFFFSGLLGRLHTEDELAGVLGHELTHVIKEHWAKAYSDSMKRELGLTALLMILNANKTLTDVAGISNTLLFDLPYSRRAETEADDQGYDLMVKAGYNPQGIVDVFTMFQKLKGSGRVPEFLSTHPDDGNRIKRLKERVDKDKRTLPAMRIIDKEDWPRPEGKDKGSLLSWNQSCCGESYKTHASVSTGLHSSLKTDELLAHNGIGFVSPEKTMLDIGQTFPDFKLQDQNGKTWSLADLKGHPAILYFYPKDDTSGCTLEACSFRDEMPRFTGAQVFGISPDTIQSHKKFAEKYKLNFTLLADVEQRLANACGIWVEKSMYGKKYMGVERTTFLIDGNGQIIKIWRKVKPQGHAEEVLEALKRPVKA